MADIEIPDDLLQLERSAEQERAKLAGLAGAAYEAQRRRWRTAADAFRAAVSAYAARADVDPDELERAVQRAVRHTYEDPAD
ncbi:hypothetical protein ACX6XY_16585 [Streptomyces sp. O3]